MKDSNYRISLDIRQTQSQATIPVKTNDTSRKLYISLTDGGAPYIIEEGCFAVLSGTKSDGTTLLNNCIIENNVIRYDFTQQTVSAEGIAECEIILYDADGGLLLSPHITIVVDARAGKASSTISSNEYTFIDEAMTAEAARASAEAARVSAESARVAAEQERVVAYRERLDADQAIEDAEDSRKAAEQERVTAENTRDAAERTRKTQENARVEAEELRGTSEEIRRANEATRKASEESRVLAEARREIAIETAKAMAIECEASGEFITLNDASNAPLSNLKVFGRTTQKTTIGKQKIAYPYGYTNKTVEGITFTDNGDGGVKITGTATGGAAYYILNGNFGVSKVPIPDWLVTGNSYTISGGKDNVLVEVFVYKEDGTGKKFSGNLTFTMPSGYVYYGIFIYVPLNTTVNTTIYPMVRDASVTDDTYEQYTGGIPSPNPDYPQDLVSVGDSGSFSVDVYGKNFVEITTDTKTSAGVTFTRNADNSFSLNGTGNANNVYNIGRAYLIQGTSYKLTGCASGGASNTYLIRVVGSNNATVAEDLGTGKTFTPTTTGFYTIGIRIQSGTVTDGLKFYPMIRLATETDSTYEPCNKQALTMPFKLPNGNEVDFGKGTRKEKTVLLTVNGSENWRYDGTYKCYHFSPSGDYNIKAKRGVGISTHFEQKKDTDLCFFVSGGQHQISIYDHNGKWANTDALKSWLSENNVTFLLELETPTETPLSEAELNAYRQLHTNKPNTIIYNSDSAQQEVTYVADTKLYIDNKFAALTAATEGVV